MLYISGTMSLHNMGVSLIVAAVVLLLQDVDAYAAFYSTIGPASLARENEAGGSWGQEVHLLHVNI